MRELVSDVVSYYEVTYVLIFTQSWWKI